MDECFYIKTFSTHRAVLPINVNLGHCRHRRIALEVAQPFPLGEIPPMSSAASSTRAGPRTTSRLLRGPIRLTGRLPDARVRPDPSFVACRRQRAGGSCEPSDRRPEGLQGREEGARRRRDPEPPEALRAADGSDPRVRYPGQTTCIWAIGGQPLGAPSTGPEYTLAGTPAMAARLISETTM